MNKEEFYKTIENEIVKYIPEELNDRKARIDEVSKDGGVKLHGLALTKGDSGAAPILYLEPYYDKYQDGWPIEDILANIANAYTDMIRLTPEIPMPDMSFENIKNKLRVRLVYNKTNYDYLEDHVYIDVGSGYCFVVYADMSDELFTAHFLAKEF